MRAPTRALLLALLPGGWPAIVQAQPLASPRVPNVVLSTRFLAPLTYEVALARLSSYYEEQVGRNLAVALPEIAMHRHFEVWHDMWVFFEPAASTTTVTLKRPTEGINTRLVKTWMVDLAGRLEAAMPLAFKEDPPLHEVEGELFVTRGDLPRALTAETALKPVATWEHAGLMVSGSSLTWVMMAPSGPHAVHRVTVAAENAAAAKQLLSKLMQGISKPGIYGAYSETAELDQEIRDLASGRASPVGVNTSQNVYLPNVDEKHLEDRVRADPEMARRTALALGQYATRFRVDKSYRKVTVSWVELESYMRETGKYQAERALGQSVLNNLKPAAPGVSPLTARSKLPLLQPGAYRIRLEGEDAGKTGKIDERTYWFDGKTFEEL